MRGIANFYDMPTLTPSDDEDDEYETDFMDDLAHQMQRPSSAQREPSVAMQMVSILSTPVNEVQPSVEQEQDCGQVKDDEEESTTFAEILNDARDNHRNKKPEFVINGNIAMFDTTRLVDMGGGQTAEMTFVAWDESKALGHWVLEDNYCHKHIVKFFNKGHCYKAWLGTEQGFNEDPIAWPEKRTTAGRILSVEDDTDAVDHGEASSDQATASSRHLRKKTYTQMHPYAADKELHAATRQGKVKRTSDIDAREAKREKSLKRLTPATPQLTPEGTRKKQRRSRSTTTSLLQQLERSPDDMWTRESQNFTPHKAATQRRASRDIPIPVPRCHRTVGQDCSNVGF